MNKYLLLICLVPVALEAMQNPGSAPNVLLTQENLATANQSSAQDVISMDTDSDSSSVATQPDSLDYDPVEEAALLAQLDALDVHTFATN